MLKVMTGLADKYDVSIVGEVSRFGFKGLYQRKLKAWYKRHGFDVGAANKLTYTPKAAPASHPHQRQGKSHGPIASSNSLIGLAKNTTTVIRLSRCSQVRMYLKDKTKPSLSKSGLTDCLLAG